MIDILANLFTPGKIERTKEVVVLTAEESDKDFEGKYDIEEFQKIYDLLMEKIPRVKVQFLSFPSGYVFKVNKISVHVGCKSDYTEIPRYILTVSDLEYRAHIPCSKDPSSYLLYRDYKKLPGGKYRNMIEDIYNAADTKFNRQEELKRKKTIAKLLGEKK